MEKTIKALLLIYKTVVTGLFAAILLLLCIFSACSTSHIKIDASELTYFVKDDVGLNLAALFCVVLVLIVISQIPLVRKFARRIQEDEAFFEKCRRILLLIGLGISVFWVLSTQYRSGADQAQVQKAVYMLHIKDYSLFAEDGYLAMYPNQLGLVWISYLLSLVFGSYNYLIFQLLSAFGIVVIYRSLANISRYCGCKTLLQLIAILVGMCFFPLTMYSSFVYGTVPGLACSLVALEREMTFFEKKKKKDLLFSGLLIVLAIQLKSNYLIFLIGMIIYAGAESLKQKQGKWLLIPILMIICYMVTNTAVLAVSEYVSGYELDQGASPWSWIAMGLQDGERAPGWYNGYNAKSYKLSGYDSAVHADLAKLEIHESVEGFKEDKWNALEFFVRKTASQWNNPTFQAFWNVQIRSMAVTQSAWSWNLIQGPGVQSCIDCLNLLQFVILSGALLFCVFGRSDEHRERILVPAMIFIGGFVFHLFWEAKGQYTIPYFILLIPYAIIGFEKTSETMIRIFKKKRTPRELAVSVLEKQFPILVFGILLVNLSIVLFGGGRLKYLAEDTLDYWEYWEERNVSPAVEEGVYCVKTKNGMVLSLGAQLEDQSREIKVIDQENLATSIGVGIEMEWINYQSDTWLRFTEEPLYLTIVDKTVPEHQLVRAVKSKLSNDQKWKTISGKNEGVYILSGKDYALTYSGKDGSVYLAPFVGDQTQLWYPE